MLTLSRIMYVYYLVLKDIIYADYNRIFLLTANNLAMHARYITSNIYIMTWYAKEVYYGLIIYHLIVTYHLIIDSSSSSWSSSSQSSPFILQYSLLYIVWRWMFLWILLFAAISRRSAITWVARSWLTSLWLLCQKPISDLLPSHPPSHH